MRELFPDKRSYKATVTCALRHVIQEIALRYDRPTYLEVGCDQGYTLLSVAESFSRCVGLDIDLKRITTAIKTAEVVAQGQDITFIHGTTQDLTQDRYDVILIDAAHDYESVKRDFQEILQVNTADEFTVIFHDYGLVDAGVRRFVHETFDQFDLVGEKTDWNPLGGPIDGPEAAQVTVKRQLR